MVISDPGAVTERNPACAGFQLAPAVGDCYNGERADFRKGSRPGIVHAGPFADIQIRDADLHQEGHIRIRLLQGCGCTFGNGIHNGAAVIEHAVAGIGISAVRDWYRFLRCPMISGHHCTSFLGV